MGGSMKYPSDRALELLRIGTNLPDAHFREGQAEAIQYIVEGHGRLLVVQKTGWGKSFVYFIATKLLRETGMGPALLISPLLALMRNQIEAAKRMGVRAVTINSDNRDAWPQVEAAITKNEVDILLISPERLANEEFQAEVLAPIAGRIGLLVIDEAHCISDWGHDFRPHYRLLERIIRTLPHTLRLLATTATANNRVMDDLRTVLGPNLQVSRGDLNRPSLTLQTIRLRSQAERLAWLTEQLPQLPGSGIIYTLTIRDAEQVSEWLKSCGLNVEAYTGETGDTRPEMEQALLMNRVKALVATTALGMGYDKPDLAFVIHYQAPGSVVAYYQQVGRAGRALDAAYGVLLSGEEDTKITEYFIHNAFPTPQEVQDILDALAMAPEGLSIHELQGKVNIRYGRIQKATELLALESPAPIAKQGSKWQLTSANLSQAFWRRAARLTELRHAEQRQMQEYVTLRAGHMTFLIRALDGDPGTVQPPTLPCLPDHPSPGLIQAAVSYLRRTHHTIAPRVRWPVGGMPQYGLKGTIKLELQAQPGKTLCMWGDAGWGSLVQQGKYEDNHFADELVQACVTMIKTWNPAPFPAWVTAIPSLRHPSLVPDFAKRLAQALNLPYHDVIMKTGERPEQKTMANNVQQARNLDGALAIKPKALPLPKGAVLLVDDMVDSRWTFTVAAWLLRNHGSGPVFPAALASTSLSE
jgi:ATP-dependent DNA helicase RecQ